MKLLWKIVKWILIIISLLILVLYFTGNEYIIRGVRLTYLKGEKTANIDDYKDIGEYLLKKNPDIKIGKNKKIKFWDLITIKKT